MAIYIFRTKYIYIFYISTYYLYFTWVSLNNKYRPFIVNFIRIKVKYIHDIKNLYNGKKYYLQFAYIKPVLL